MVGISQSTAEGSRPATIRVSDVLAGSDVFRHLPLTQHHGRKQTAHIGFADKDNIDNATRPLPVPGA